MRERYESRFRRDWGLYTAGSPLILSSGSLLEDSSRGKLLCQIRFRSISSRTVRSVQVAVTMRDGEGQDLGEPVIHRFTDLMLKRDEEYGKSSAIVLPIPEAQSFRAEITEVGFLDGGVWRPGSMPWVGLKKPQTLEEVYGDKELAEQYRIQYGADCRYAPLTDGELWLCTCGSYNHVDETRCHRCRRSLSALRAVSAKSLHREKKDRQESDQGWQERERAREEKEKKNRLRRLAIGIPTALLVLALLLTVPRALQHRRDYEQATALRDQGRYEQAAARFAVLGSYRDSREQVDFYIPYLQALELMHRAQADDSSALSLIGKAYSDLDEQTSAAMLLFPAARERFLALGDYLDSPELAEQCAQGALQARRDLLQDDYDRALELLERGSYSQARSQFLALGDYEDAAEMALECVYRKADGLLSLTGEYNVEQVYASLRVDPEGTSVFSLNRDLAMRLGSQFLGQLRRACGQDLVDIRLEDVPDRSLTPLDTAVRELFASLGDYRDSGEKSQIHHTDPQIQEQPEETPEPAEPTPALPEETPAQPEESPAPVESPEDTELAPFFQLLEEGELQAGLDWLEAYEGTWRLKSTWQSRLERWLPWCSDWVFGSGDPTLIPLSLGGSDASYAFRSRILIRDDAALLILEGEEGPGFRGELPQLEGENRFLLSADPYHYFVYINDGGSLIFMKYDSSGHVIGTCEYRPG